MKRLRNQGRQGHALVTLLVVMAVSMVILSAAVGMSIITAQSSSRLGQTQQALLVAESGMENALLRLLRDPAYSGEVVDLGGGTATVSVAGTNPIVLTSVGVSGSIQRTVRVEVQEVGGSQTVTKWKEVW